MSSGVPWANLSNTPFRMYKHWIHEGGIATPFIVHWPAGLQADTGRFEREPAAPPESARMRNKAAVIPSDRF